MLEDIVSKRKPYFLATLILIFVLVAIALMPETILINQLPQIGLFSGTEENLEPDAKWGHKISVVELTQEEQDFVNSRSNN